MAKETFSNYSEYNQAFKVALRYGALNVAKFIKSSYPNAIDFIDPLSISSVCRYGHVDVLKWLMTQKWRNSIDLHGIISRPIESSIESPSVDMLEFILSQSTIDKKFDVTDAIQIAKSKNRLNHLNILIEYQRNHSSIDAKE